MSETPVAASRFGRAVCASVLVFSAATAWPGPQEKTFKVTGYIGVSTVSAASNVQVLLVDKATGEVLQTDQTNLFGKYTFKEVRPGAYLVKVESVTREIVVKDKNVRVDLDLSAPGGAMDYSKSAGALNSGSVPGGGGGTAAPPGPSDAELAKYFAGEYYSYSGSTERKVMFCAEGVFFDSAESSYSGSMSDGLGNQTGAWGAANQRSGSGGWSIQGTKEGGLITLQYKNGKTVQVKYQVTGERGCWTLDGVTFCYSGPARCGK